MDENHSELLERARALALAKVLIEREIAELVQEARQAGTCVAELARSLGVHRASIYRWSDPGEDD